MHREIDRPTHPAAPLRQPLDAPGCPHNPAPCDDCLALALATAQALGLDAARPAALDWPAWTDEDRWELGPDLADDQWQADGNANWHTDEPTPPYALGDGLGVEDPDAL